MPVKDYYFTLIMLAVAGISWLNYRLISRLFRCYQGRLVICIYLFFTMATICVIGYEAYAWSAWTRRLPFNIPEHSAYRYLIGGALAWLVGQLTLLVLQPVIYAVNRLIRKNEAAETEESSSQTMTRRAFLHSTLAITPIFAMGNGVTGIYEAQFDMVAQRHSLVMPNLPPNLNGFKIGQVSDTHLGPYFDLARLDTVIQMLAKEKPDLVVITGDLADDLSLLKPTIDRFDNLQSSIPYGIYFCFGNHDYFRNAELVRTELKKSRIQTLDNASAFIVDGQHPFYLMGVDYPRVDAARIGITVSAAKRQEYVAAANRNVPPDAFKVLIAHHPDFLFDGFAARIPLTLAGHTHGGQVVIGGKPLLAQYAYMRGLYRENGVYGYVSSGAGHWFPFRLGCPPEISMFTLTT